MHSRLVSSALSWSRLIGVLVPIFAAIGAVAVGLGIIALSGASINNAINAFLDGAVGSHYAFGASINRAVTLCLVGLGFIVAKQANLINAGAEGQIAVGGIATTAIALYAHVEKLPFGLPIFLPLAAGTLAGACWGGIGGVMKARLGTDEVLSTLMLTFIGLLLVYWSVESDYLLRQPRTSAITLPESLPIPPTTQMPLLFGDLYTPMNVGLIIALAAAVVVAIALTHSAFGLRLLAIGFNDIAARRAGLRPAILSVIALAISGGMAGLAGAIMLQGQQLTLQNGFSSGYGFDGLVVGLLSRGSAVGVVIGAAFFGFLRSGSLMMEISARVPAALVLIIQGLIVIVIAGSAVLVEKISAQN